jgi:hypothetical protein
MSEDRGENKDAGERHDRVLIIVIVIIIIMDIASRGAPATGWLMRYSTLARRRSPGWNSCSHTTWI